MATSTKAVPRAKKTVRPVPVASLSRSAGQIRSDLATAEAKIGGMSRWQDAKKYDALKASIDRDRAELDLAEAREVAPPAEVTTDFQERSIALATIDITGNHREHHDEASLHRLAESLKTQNLQQRIGVRARGDGRFELIFGNRRFQAARLAGWEEIPAKVYDSSLTPAQVEILRSIENFGRKNLTPVEEAVAVARVIEAIKATVLGPIVPRGGTALTDDIIEVWDSPMSRFGVNNDFKAQPAMITAKVLVASIKSAGGLEAYVGQQFSRSAKWVKDHAYVSKLGGKSRELLMAGRIDIGHARELAKLGDKARADGIAVSAARDEQRLGGRDVAWVRKSVMEELRSLRIVPWQLDIAFGQGVPGCIGQACQTCPFNSKTDPDLFGGSITDEPEAGKCTNGACFEAKTKIIDTELAKATKKALPVVKKVIDRAGDEDASNPVTLTTVGHLLPRIAKPASGLRRLQKELGHLTASKSSDAPEETSAASGTTSAAKQTPEERAKDKLDAATRKWEADLNGLLSDAVLSDPSEVARRLGLIILLDRSDWAGEYFNTPINESAAQIAKGEPLIAAVCNGDAATLLKALSKRFDLEYLINELSSYGLGDVLNRILSAWGVAVPRRPELADFLPKPKTARPSLATAAKNGATSGGKDKKVLHVRRDDDGDGVAGVEGGGVRSALGDDAHGAGSRVDGQPDGGAGDSETVDELDLGNGKTIDPDTIDILRRCTIAPLAVALPAEQLGRKRYERVNAVLELLGGKWSKKARAHVFDVNPAALVAGVVNTGRVVDRKKALAFFETPEDLADRVAMLANVGPEDWVLEPSAGTGRLVRAVLSRSVRAQVTAVEIDPQNVDALSGICDDVLRGDFLTIDLAGYGPFDRVVANPPYLGRTWQKHVDRMIELLKPDGVLVCVLPITATTTAPGIAEWRERLEQRTSMRHFESVPAGTFKSVGTNIETCILVARKNPADAGKGAA